MHLLSPWLIAIARLCLVTATYANSSNSNVSDTFNVGTCYVNWAIYGRNFTPSELPIDHLTHIFYAFAKITNDGTVVLSDPWADTDKHFPNDTWVSSGQNVYGFVKQLFLLKKRNRNLKTLLSIGGWPYSSAFMSLTDSDSWKRFANSAPDLVIQLGFDGIDIDWEYPAKPDEAQAFVSLPRLTRNRLSKTPLLMIGAGANGLTDCIQRSSIISCK